MKITYEMIFSILNSKFNLVTGEKKNYFLDDSQRIAATIDQNLIVMFYAFPSNSREIWNHKGKVAVSFVRNFNVNDQICDVLCIEGLCGASNDFVLEKDFFIDTTNNYEMRYLLDSNEKSLFKIEDEYALGNCGHLSSKNGIASFDICGVVKVDNMVVNTQDDGINVINFKNIHKDTNYNEVYHFYRHKNAGSYKVKYNTTGSYETRAFTERRRYSIVDKNAIHVSKDVIYNSILGPIYKKKNQSLNAKRLEMIYTLNLLLDNRKKSIDYVSSHYSFNIRNCDFIRQRVKK